MDDRVSPCYRTHFRTYLPIVILSISLNMKAAYHSCVNFGFALKAQPSNTVSNVPQARASL